MRREGISAFRGKEEDGEKLIGTCNIKENGFFSFFLFFKDQLKPWDVKQNSMLGLEADNFQVIYWLSKVSNKFEVLTT